MVDRLEERTSRVIQYITDTIPVAERAILAEGNSRFSIAVPGFEDEFILQFREPLCPTDVLVNDGGESPIFKTGREAGKFKDLYWKALDQAPPDTINVLAINTDSKTHGRGALRICIHYLDTLSRRSNIERRYCQMLWMDRSAAIDGACANRSSGAGSDWSIAASPLGNSTPALTRATK